MNKRASLEENILRSLAAADAGYNAAANNRMNALDWQRFNNLALAHEQRRVGHLKSLTGESDAATKLKRLNYTKLLPYLATAGAGALLGGVAGAATGRAEDGAALGGAVLGGGIGILAAALANGIGGFRGSIESTNREELKNRINNLGAYEYLVPGPGAYLRAQLFKDFEENESRKNRPNQMVF